MENKKNLSPEEISLLKKKRDREQEQEKLAILMEADRIKGENLMLDFEGNIVLENEINGLKLEEIDDPETKYELYYKVINKLLKEHLPKGREFEKARKLIYEEKNTFLTRGHRVNDKGIRGADGRMAYVPDINELVNVVTKWIANKGTMYDLYQRILELNISKNYGEPQ